MSSFICQRMSLTLFFILFPTPFSFSNIYLLQMQSGMYAQQTGRLDPFGSNGAATTASYSSVAPGQASSASVGASVTTNTNFGTTNNTATATATTSSNHPLISTVTAILEEQPLVSNDGGRTVELLGNKIIALTMPNEGSAAAAAATGNEGGAGSVMISALSDEEKVLMRSLITTLTATTTTTSSTSSGINTLPMSEVILLFNRILDRHANAEMACLFLLRLVVLRDSFFTSEPTPLILTILNRLKDGTAQTFKTPPAIVMALCVISNLLGSEQGRCYALGDGHQPGVVGISELLLDVILKHLTHARVEIRQISATALYNLILAYTTANSVSSTGNTPGDISAASGGSNVAVTSARTIWDNCGGAVSAGDGELSGSAVQVFLGCLEEITEEVDTGVRHRRLCSALRIVRAGKGVAVALGKDLGFAETLARINVSSTSAGNERNVVMELRRLLA